MNRRKFIYTSSLATGSVFIPSFLKAFETPSAKLAVGNKKLVVMQLSGGNDGLNTLVPFRNDLYYSLRPDIALKRSETLLLNDDISLNPALSEFRNLYDEGHMCILNNIGYPNPDYSHFRSMDIWQTASATNTIETTGWIGRYLDQLPDHLKKPHMAIDFSRTLNTALKGSEINGFSIPDYGLMSSLLSNKLLRKKKANFHDHHNDSNSYLHKTLSETFSSADYILEKNKSFRSKITYPNNVLGKDLKNIAELINANTDTNVYYVSAAGFDTHANQLKQQYRYLKIVDEAMDAFIKDIKTNNLFNDVLIMVFSEFGRRVAQNASNGTDHGAANVLFLISGALKSKGIYNPLPDLTNLIDGNLKYTIDFKSVYATILSKWLSTDPSKIVGNWNQLANIV
ncbi:MAG TPA: DUF1501 domain-containing protein [Bacteroidia bacterium]|nr:DUF1501 domain-containing protein [Bacteroidia bacterium]HNU32474.1 DUF1501 domain-containing protein [Bacteroidia bacterium]